MVAPRQIPQNLVDEYTMQGQIRQEYLYFNDDYKQVAPKVYTQAQINKLLQEVAKRQTKYYGAMDTHLYEALEQYSIRDRTVAIMGSQYPWYESICLHYGGKPTVIDYHKIQSQHPEIQTLTIDEYDQNPIQFDIAFSISSFEHDGLGRYGDPLNPNADIQAMQKMKRILKRDGLLFLSIPVGEDKLVWNAHRIYGRTRLPNLLQGWEILDIFGFDQNIYREDTGSEAKYQPIFVLRNTEKIISITEIKNYLNQSKASAISPTKIEVSTPETGLKLHLGCGTKRLPGFVHVDVRPDVNPDVVADITDLREFSDNSAELIYFCHGFEHVRPQQIDSTLAEWKRVLKPGGILRLSMPDFEVLARLYVTQNVPLENIAYIIHGGQDYPENTHYFSWDFASLSKALKKAGFAEIQRYDADAINPPDYSDYSTYKFYGQQLSLNVEATKPVSQEILLVTSLAPGNLENQKRALESWQAQKFSIVSLNTPAEISQLKSDYPQITFHPVKRDASQAFGKPFVYLDDLLAYLRDRGTSICGIINSDIHLQADSQFLGFIREQAQNSLVFGSRVDVDATEQTDGTIYAMGFDFFFFDKRLLDRFPTSPYCLGMPWWDYWVPCIAQQNGINLKFLTTPLARHIKHQTNYSQDAWQNLGLTFVEQFEPASLPKLQAMQAKPLRRELISLSQRLIQTLQDNSTKISYELPPPDSILPSTDNIEVPETDWLTELPDETPTSATSASQKTISLLCPTRGRPQQALRLALSVLKTASKPKRVEILFYVDEDDETQEDYKSTFSSHYPELSQLKRYAIVIGDPIGISRAWNELARLCKGDLLIMAADDQIYNDAGWDDRLDQEVEKYPDEIFCMWFNDGHLGDKLCTFPIVSRKWCTTLGYFVTGFFECFCDDVWIMDIAKRVGRLHYIPDVLTEHLNWRYGKAEIDATYERRQVDTQGQFKPSIERDKALFIRTDHYRKADARKIAAVMSEPVTLKVGIQWAGVSSIFDLPPAYEDKSKPSKYLLNVNLGVNFGNQRFKILLDTKKLHQRQIWSQLDKGKLYEPEIAKTFAKFVEPGDCVIDIGAHVGYYTLLGASLVGKEGKVLAFEPDIANCEAITQNLELNELQNVKLFQLALDAEIREAKFFVNHDNDGGHALWDVSLHSANQRTRHNKLVRQLKTSTLDEVLADKGLSKIKLIKLDAEGAEYNILQGGLETLKSYEVPYVICEINQFGLKQMGGEMKSLLTWMQDLGYHIYLLRNQGSQFTLISPEEFEMTSDVAVLFSRETV